MDIWVWGRQPACTSRCLAWISFSCSSSLFFRRSLASSFFSGGQPLAAAILIGISLSHPVPQARVADPEILSDPGDRHGALTREPDRALPELWRMRDGHDGHPSQWPLATPGQVSGRRGKLTPPLRRSWRQRLSWEARPDRRRWHIRGPRRSSQCPPADERSAKRSRGLS